MFKKNTGGVKVHTSTYSRQGSGHPTEKALPSTLVYGLNPRRSQEPAELVKVSCRYSVSLRTWLCLKNIAERWHPEACIHYSCLWSRWIIFYFFYEQELPKVKDLKLVWQCLSCEAVQVIYRNEGPDVAFNPWPRDVEIYKH